MKPQRTSERLRSLLAVCVLACFYQGTLWYTRNNNRRRRRFVIQHPGGEDSSGATGFTGRADRPLSGPFAGPSLAASTYPLQIIMLQRWLEKNSGLKDKQLADAVAKQPWDPAVQALAPLTDVVKRLGDDIQWTVDLGNAFLAQQSDVMDAVQRMRKKAHEKGSLKTTEQQKVETKVIETKTVIVIEPANPQVIYVPSYNPTVVWGAAVLSLSTDLLSALGLRCHRGCFVWRRGDDGSLLGRRWGWGCGWGAITTSTSTTISIAARMSAISTAATATMSPAETVQMWAVATEHPLSRRGGSKWQHNPQNRGGTPYRDRATADRFGGSARGDSIAQRQGGAQQRIGQQGGNLASNVDRGGFGDRSAWCRRQRPRLRKRHGNRSSWVAIESAAGMSRVREAETGMRLEAAPEDTAGRARAAAAVAARPACLGGGGFSRGGGGGGFSRGGGGGRRR